MQTAHITLSMCLEFVRGGLCPQVTYGLNKRNRPEEEKGHERGGREVAQMAGRSERGSEKAQFKAECEVLPEQANEETYDAMPIEMFGEAMLRGMGCVTRRVAFP
jgi:hypothetical protein